MDKQAQMLALISELRNENSVQNIVSKRKGELVNVGLINPFQLHERIPNKWFDWVNSSANAEVMIIGQDWGPYSVLEKFISTYDESRSNDSTYHNEFLLKDFTSRTEKFILNAVNETYENKFNKVLTPENWSKLFFTMAVLFTRQGKHFRGNHNFDEKKSFEISYPYVKKQIDIMKPKLIIPLGNLAFEVVNRYYDLGYKEVKISKIVESLPTGFIKVGNVNILPNFHPAAYIDPKIQTEIWRKMWDVVEV